MRNCLIASLLGMFATLAAAQSPCPDRLFVSGYFSNVHIFDACTGAYVRDLDPGRIHGAQAVVRGPDGRLYVVSEETSEILRYRNDTLAFDGVFVSVPGIAPTSIAFGPDGLAYVSGYATSDVRVFDRAGLPVRIAIPPHAAGLAGPDIGMRFVGGMLYVPGYDSNSIVRHDPATGANAIALAPRTAGMAKPRSLLASGDGKTVFISAEGSSQVLRWTLATGDVVQLARVTRAQGIDFAPDGSLVVGTREGVVKLDAVTGALVGDFVSPGAGGISGLTFVAVIPAATPAARTSVVEFYNATLDHYFISAAPAEIAALDGGTLKGWVRTGLGFNAYDGPAPGAEPVCRFYLPPAFGDSHFYSASATECAAVHARFPDFVAESPEVFEIGLPDPATGDCASGAIPVYRLWNGRIDSNHRYTTDAAVKAQMVARGYVAEGYGPAAVALCAAA